MTILRDLITEAMEMKAKRQQEQQRELEEEDDNSVRSVYNVVFSPFVHSFGFSIALYYIGHAVKVQGCMYVSGGGGGGGLSHHGEIWLRKCWHHESNRHYE